jgi:hypothetical protein
MRRTLAALTAAAAGLAAVPAMAVTFDFSFTNTAYGGGLVRGTISNLVDDATGPGDVEVGSNAGGYGVGIYNGNTFNSFTLSGGRIVGYDYASFGVLNDDPTACCSLALSSDEGGGLSDVADDVAKAGPVTFTAVSEEPAPIPLPAPIALLAAGLALLVGIGRRRPAAARWR